MTLGAPEWMTALWLLPVLVVLAILALRSRAKAVALLGPLIGAEVGRSSASRARRRLILIGLSLALIVAALAQPRWGFRWTELKQEGTHIVVVLDTSLSMDAQDVSPSRMERAHREVLDLADLLQGDRVGLVLFSGGAYTRMPVTHDYGALRNMVRKANTATLKAQGSDLGAAIRMATAVAGAGENSDRAMIIISDGEDQVGNAQAAAEEAVEAGVHIFAIGIGTTDGAPIPLASGGFKKDEAGELVLSRIEEDTLQMVAQIGGGAYVRSVAGSGDIRALYQDEILGKLKREEQISRREKVWLERFQWPLGLAWLLGLAAFAVRGRVAVVLLVLALGAGSQPAHAQDSSVEALTKAQTANPDDLSVAERLGGALFKAGQFNQAEAVLGSVADRSKDSDARARARYNASLAAYKAGRLTAALEGWQRVLQDHPEHPGAKKNAGAVQAEIQKRLGEDPPPQDGDGESEDGDGEQEPPEDGGDTGAPQNDGTREPPPPPEGGDTGAAEPPEDSESQPAEPAGGDTGSAPAEPVEVKEISQSEAERMFDAVQEGDPRVVINPDSKGGNDW